MSQKGGEKMKKRGFTLIELLIVIVIIGILAVIGGLFMANNAKNKANDARKKSDLKSIQDALEVYRTDNDTYPAQLNALVPDYMSAVPTSPDNNAYTYTPGNPATTYSLTVTLANSNDKGPGVVNGVFTLANRQ